MESLIEFCSTCQFVTFQLEDMLMEGLLGFCSMSIWWSWLLNFNILTRSLYIEFVWRSICDFETTISTLIYKWRVLEFCSTCQFVILELLSFNLSIGNLIENFKGHFESLNYSTLIYSWKTCWKFVSCEFFKFGSTQL